MRTISAIIDIGATPQQVWRVPADLDCYPQRNPLIRSAPGEPAEGASLTLRLVPAQGRSMTFRPPADPRRDTASRLRTLGTGHVVFASDSEGFLELSGPFIGSASKAAAETGRAVTVTTAARTRLATGTVRQTSARQERISAQGFSSAGPYPRWQLALFATLTAPSLRRR